MVNIKGRGNIWRVQTWVGELLDRQEKRHTTFDVNHVKIIIIVNESSPEDDLDIMSKAGGKNYD